MVTCTSCGCGGFLTEFTYLAQAGGVGSATLRRCPACGELVIINEPDATDAGDVTPPETTRSAWHAGRDILHGK